MKELDKITDIVLAYRPKPKTKAAKRRIRRNKRQSSALIRQRCPIVQSAKPATT